MRFEIVETAPAFGGREFGAAGAYEVVTARAVIGVDPAQPRNSGIVDLGMAPKNAAGLVEATAPVLILRPADPSRGNGTLLYEVNNRGRVLGLALFNDGPLGNDLKPADRSGNGFLMAQGYTMAWSGWQFDAPTSAGQLALSAPTLKGVSGKSREEFVFDKTIKGAQKVSLTYPALESEQGSATLTVRAQEDDARLAPTGLSWRFLSATELEITPPAGYDAGAIYELIYVARDPVVAGLSFAAVRDVAAFLKSGKPDHEGRPNPLAKDGKATVTRAIGFGISQSGRFVKDLVYEGFHVDEAGRPVFDALWPHIAGGRRGFFNARFAQPGRYSRQHEDHVFPGDQFPFAYPVVADPLSGRTDGVLATCRKEGNCPLIIHSDTDTEGFQGRGALMTTSPDGRPLMQPDNVRLYYLAGVPHFSLAGSKAGATPTCRAPTNPLHAGPVARGLLVALERWMRDGVAPPASRYPNLADDTLIPADQMASTYPQLPGIGWSGPVNRVSLVDHSSMPPVQGPAYAAWVPRPDADGHALGAVRLPQIEAPKATYLGWNLRRDGFASGDLCGLNGSAVSLPATAGAAAPSGADKRRALSERYADDAAYVAAVERSATRLVADRLMLANDAKRLVDLARDNRLAALP